MVYSWLHQKGGVVDETCQPYQAKSKSCSKMNVCRDCKHSGGCYAVKNPTKYKVAQYGFVRGEKNMMAEIKARGPITCRQAVTKAFFKYKGGVFKDTSGAMKPQHATSVVGWGKTKDGHKYWVVRNSWGTYFGENGYFKIAKGINNLGIEDECTWGVPEAQVLEKSLSNVLGSEDKLVTSEDLGGSIDGTETLVQDAATPTKLKEMPSSPKHTQRVEETSQPAVKPEAVVTAQDDHSGSFFEAEVQKDTETDHSAPKMMLADEDPEFRHEQRKNGVQ